MRGKRTEVQSSETVSLDLRQGHSEDALFAPLEVQTGDVEVTTEWIGEEEAVGESPRSVLLPRVRNESIAEFVREIRVNVFAVLPDVNRDVSDESVGVGVFGSELVAANAAVGGKIEDVERVRADILGGVADTDSSCVKNPETAALVSCRGAIVSVKFHSMQIFIQQQRTFDSINCR